VSYKFNPFTGTLDDVGPNNGNGVPGGSTTQVQFNDAGAFAGDADLTWNKTANILGVTGDVSLDDGVVGFTTTFQTIPSTANRTISLPDATGTVALVAGSSGQVVYNNAGANAGITAGTTGQVLVSQAVGSVPVWGSGLVSGTSIASTSGVSVDFLNIPSWVKRVTVMFNGVSTNGTSNILVQIGNTTFQTSGYSSSAVAVTGGGTGYATSTAGLVVFNDLATDVKQGAFVLTLQTGTTYVCTHTFSGPSGRNIIFWGSGVSPSVGSAIDRIRITTVNGLDAFDAGSINILYE
jgi:hypothetical protein